MATFVRLTTSDGRPIWLNLETVTALQIDPNGEYTRVFQAGEEYYVVKESPDEILAPLEGR